MLRNYTICAGTRSQERAHARANTWQFTIIYGTFARSIVCVCECARRRNKMRTRARERTLNHSQPAVICEIWPVFYAIDVGVAEAAADARRLMKSGMRSRAVAIANKHFACACNLSLGNCERSRMFYAAAGVPECNCRQ